MDKTEVFEQIDENNNLLIDTAQKIWETPELGLNEENSSQILIDILEKEQFKVESGIGGMPTAFVASYGNEHPYIGVLGEYDALPNLSQKIKTKRDPIETDQPGHGCGHNLFGTASVGATIGVKKFLENNDISGTIKFYGCPAEETLIGKVYMAKAGAFDELDAALTWHPDSLTRPRMSTTNALDSIRFTFNGTSAHAAAAPMSGRSALDAIEIMNIGTEYMREHISDDARIHYVITNGGKAPNVIPAKATVWYYIRAPKRKMVERYTVWVRDIAEAAAKMTQTSVKERFLTGCYDYRPNKIVTNVIQENIEAVDSIDYNESDRTFASDLKATISEEQIEAELGDLPNTIYNTVRDEPLYAEPIEMTDNNQQSHGSTEVGDVSWLTPTGELRAAAWPVGTPAHTWQAVVANGDFGQKSIAYAAKVLAGTAYDLLNEKKKIRNANREFDHEIGKDAYNSPLPKDAEPPFEKM